MFILFPDPLVCEADVDQNQEVGHGAWNLVPSFRTEVRAVPVPAALIVPDSGRLAEELLIRAR
jgi:hypothetical protein